MHQATWAHNRNWQADTCLRANASKLRTLVHFSPAPRSMFRQCAQPMPDMAGNVTNPLPQGIRNLPFHMHALSSSWESNIDRLRWLTFAAACHGTLRTTPQSKRALMTYPAERLQRIGGDTHHARRNHCRWTNTQFTLRQTCSLKHDNAKQQWPSHDCNARPHLT
jgi:hypothetical protein